MPVADSDPPLDPRPRLDELDVRRTADEVRRRLFGIESEPVRLGRFQIDGIAGTGAMGLVHTAYDPLLQRRIAIKVIRPSESGTRADALLEEARSLAKLTHPHVVPVYEVGTVDGEVFVAMELVEGDDLRGWLAAATRSRREVLEVLDQALAGLEAAHEAGLVHRDFKPDNVLIGGDGRVRVADFGLASALEPDGDVADVDATAAPARVAGTPAYMAPEVAAGAPATTASDQYSVGVTLFEALHGHRPAEQPSAGPSPSVPRWLERVVERAMASEPGARHRSLGDLRIALRADPVRRLRRVGGVGLLATAVVGAYGLGYQPPLERCMGARDELAEAWSENRRERVQHALAAVDRSYAASTATRIAKALDDYADAWAEQHKDACEATAVRGDQSAEVMDMRMACLRRARVTLSAVAGQLEQGDRATLDAADRVLGGLLPLERCSDVDALSREAPLAPEALLARLAEARAMGDAGRYEDAVAALRGLKAEVDPDQHAALLTEVQVALGAALEDAGRYEDAVVVLERAIESGLEGRHERSTRRAASILAHTLGERLGRGEEALVYSRVALAMLGKTPSPTAEAAMRANYALVLAAQNRNDEAETQLRRALALEVEALGPDDLEVASSRNSLGVVLRKQARYEEARSEYVKALEIREEALGADHPFVGAVRTNLANVLRDLGRLEEAETQMREALGAMERTLGPDHPDVAATVLNLGVLLYERGELDEAERYLLRATELLSKSLGPDHPTVAGCRMNLSNIHAARGDYEQAEVEDRAVVASLSASVGPEHPHVATGRWNLGSTLRHLGRYEEAEAELRAAIELQHRVLGPRDLSLGRARWDLGAVLEARGQPDAALVELEAAMSILRLTLNEDDSELRSLETAIDRLRAG